MRALNQREVREACLEGMGRVPRYSATEGGALCPGCLAKLLGIDMKMNKGGGDYLRLDLRKVKKGVDNWKENEAISRLEQFDRDSTESPN